MVDKETFIDKIGAHPRIWGTIALAAAACCIVLGLLGLLPIKTVPVEDTASKTASFTKAKGSLVRCDEECFAIRNTFCRYLPTGEQYFYLAYTEDGQPVLVRAGKNWADSFDGDSSSVEVFGAVNSFNLREKAYIGDTYALDPEGFVDLIYVRLNILLIAAGVLLLADFALGALMIKEKICPQSKGYSFANIVFCTLPIAAAALGIHLVGFV